VAHVQKLRDYKDKLRQVHSRQHQSLIATKSFFDKTHHLFRTLGPSATPALARDADELHVEALSASLGFTQRRFFGGSPEEIADQSDALAQIRLPLSQISRWYATRPTGLPGFVAVMHGTRLAPRNPRHRPGVGNPLQQDDSVPPNPGGGADQDAHTRGPGTTHPLGGRVAAALSTIAPRVPVAMAEGLDEVKTIADLQECQFSQKKLTLEVATHTAGDMEQTLLRVLDLPRREKAAVRLRLIVANRAKTERQKDRNNLKRMGKKLCFTLVKCKPGSVCYFKLYFWIRVR